MLVGSSRRSRGSRTASDSEGRSKLRSTFRSTFRSIPRSAARSTKRWSVRASFVRALSTRGVSTLRCGAAGTATGAAGVSVATEAAEIFLEEDFVLVVFFAAALADGFGEATSAVGAFADAVFLVETFVVEVSFVEAAFFDVVVPSFVTAFVAAFVAVFVTVFFLGDVFLGETGVEADSFAAAFVAATLVAFFATTFVVASPFAFGVSLVSFDASFGAAFVDFEATFVFAFVVAFVVAFAAGLFEVDFFTGSFSGRALAGIKRLAVGVTSVVLLVCGACRARQLRRGADSARGSFSQQGADSERREGFGESTSTCSKHLDEEASRWVMRGAGRARHASLVRGVEAHSVTDSEADSGDRRSERSPNRPSVINDL
jgi:hypothetical protein